jgi:hypothetical protein
MRYLPIKLTPSLASKVRLLAERMSPGWKADLRTPPLPPHTRSGHWEVALRKAGKGKIVGVQHSTVTRFRVSRDADNPKPGEKFNSKRGDVWEVVSENGPLIRVKKVGFKDVGELVWSRGTLKHMKMVRQPSPFSFFSGLGSHGEPEGKSALGDPPGKKRRGTSYVQAVHFAKSVFTKEKARAWLRKKKLKVAAIEETPAQLRVRQKTSKQFKRFWTLCMDRGVSFVMGVK